MPDSISKATKSKPAATNHKFTADTGVTNLIRNTKSGIYYARIVHQRRDHWKSLKTDVFAVAKQKLRKFEDDLRGRKVSKKGVTMTFGQAAQIYAEQVALERLSAATKEFRLRPTSTFRRTWPDLAGTDIRRISEGDCIKWLQRYENGAATYTPHHAKSTVPGNSPTVINACIAYLRRVFDVAIKEGLIGENPARSMKRMPARKRLLELPSRTQFQDIITHVRNSRSRWGKAVGDLVEGLAYSGMRLKEAGRMTWSDINLENGIMNIRGSKTEGSIRTVPLIPAMRELLFRIEKGGPKVFTAESALGSLKSACKALKVAKINHHDLRHLYATTVIESGVDIPTLSRWLGHVDGGALCMKTYGHLRPLHSAEAAAKVRF